MILQRLKRDSVPLHAEVATLLRNQIYAGVLPAGSQLPPLSELTKQLGIARMTIRQAMDALEDEGLIERHSGRGTFVREVKLPKRRSLKMDARLEQLHSMVEQLEVAVVLDENHGSNVTKEGAIYRRMSRIHTQDNKPFCHVDICLAKDHYDRAPERFASEIVVSVLRDLGVEVITARQRVTISYADVDIAEALDVKVNSPVFKVFREFFGGDDQLIYSAVLIYPGDVLEFDVTFSTDKI